MLVAVDPAQLGMPRHPRHPTQEGDHPGCLTHQRRRHPQADGRGEPYAASRTPEVPRRTSWAAPSVVSSTRLHAVGKSPIHRYAGIDDGRGTDQMLDANRLTPMSGRQPCRLWPSLTISMSWHSVPGMSWSDVYPAERLAAPDVAWHSCHVSRPVRIIKHGDEHLAGRPARPVERVDCRDCLVDSGPVRSTAGCRCVVRLRRSHFEQ